MNTGSQTMRIHMAALAVALAGCATSSLVESPANSTIKRTGAAERNCDRPTTVLTRESLPLLRSTPVRTTLRFEVAATGEVGTVTVKTSSGQKVLDDAAVAAIKKMKCTPLQAGSPSVLLESWYEFQLQ